VSVTGPTSVVPTPTPPSLLQHVSWPGAFSAAFDYTVDPDQDVSTYDGVNDNAVLYFFGHDAATAIHIPPGGSHTVSASLFLTEPGAGFPGCEEDGLAALHDTPAGGLASGVVHDVVEPAVGSIDPALGQEVHEINCGVIVPLEDEIDGLL